ncbi:hypothetical protein Salat_2046700 [Sesamum alatum]|uniref:Uncharacterized protein n=1 Tax=Sesamum alatum TaxID=300844 RepID=A0AAE2CG86_9LAMI|nr:hypothetical protein Salat_2046700 [Sesamum alatum]
MADFQYDRRIIWPGLARNTGGVTVVRMSQRIAGTSSGALEPHIVFNYLGGKHANKLWRRQGICCEDWMRHIAKHLDPSQFGWFLVVCWSLWTSRNAKLMEGTQDDPLSVIKTSKEVHNCIWKRM